MICARHDAIFNSFQVIPSLVILNKVLMATVFNQTRCIYDLLIYAEMQFYVLCKVVFKSYANKQFQLNTAYSQFDRSPVL